MATQDDNNKVLIGLLSISEEVSSLNWKLKQMVEILHSDDSGLGTLKELSSTLRDRVKQIEMGIKQYKPVKDGKQIQPTPSNEDGLNERVRIVPTPENFMEFTDDSQYKTPLAKAAPKSKKERNVVTPKQYVTKPKTQDSALLKQPLTSSETQVDGGIVSKTEEIIENFKDVKKRAPSVPDVSIASKAKHMSEQKKKEASAPKKRAPKPKKPTAEQKQKKRDVIEKRQKQTKKKGGFFGRKK